MWWPPSTAARSATGTLSSWPNGFRSTLHSRPRRPHGCWPVAPTGVADAAIARWRPNLDRRLYAWQVGQFIQDSEERERFVALLYEQFLPARPAFWRLNDDLLGTVITRRRPISQPRCFEPPVRVIFGIRDRYLNPRVAKQLAALFPNSELHLLDGAGHYVQVDQPRQVADLIVAK